MKHLIFSFLLTISLSSYGQAIDWTAVNYNLGDPTKFEVEGLFALEGRGLVGAFEFEEDGVLPTGLYQLDEAAKTWIQIGGAPTQYGFGTLRYNGETLFESAGTHDGTLYFDLSSGEWQSVMDNTGERVSLKVQFVVDDMMYELVGDQNEGFWVEAFDIATKTYKELGKPAQGKSPPLPPENRNKLIGIAALKNGKVYMGYRDKNLDDSGSTDKVRGRIYEWDEGKWTDISNTGINWINPTGGIGPMGSLFPNSDFSKMYVSSLLNTYLKDDESKGWFQVANFPYGEGVVGVFGDYILGASGNELYRYENHLKVTLGTNPIVEGCPKHSESRYLTSTDEGKSRFYAVFKVDPSDCPNKKVNKGIYTYKLNTSDAPAVVSNLHVNYASYVGNQAGEGAGNDIQEVRIGANNFYLAGNFPNGVDDGESVIYSEIAESKANAPGKILITSGKPENIIKVLSLGSAIYDIDLNEDGSRLVAVGSFGVACIDSEGKYLWHVEESVTAAAKVSIAENNQVVVLLASESNGGGVVKHYNPDGTEIGVNTLRDQNGVTITDVLIHSGTNHRMIYLSGYVQASSDLQVAYLDGYNISDINDLEIRTWGHSASEALGNGDVADTRIYHIAASENYVYVAGESAGGGPGGASVYAYNGLEINGTKTALEGNDAYSDGVNSCGPCHITYLAKINPSSGEVIKGKFIHARLTSGKTNTHRVRNGSLTVDENENIHVGAVSAAYIQNRNNLNINGKLVDTYAGGDMVYLMLSPDMNTRYVWTVFSADAGKGLLQGVASAFGKTAIVGTTNNGKMFTTDEALVSETMNRQGNEKDGITEITDAYFATWGANVWENANLDGKEFAYIPADTCYTEICDKAFVDDPSAAVAAFNAIRPANLLTPNGDGQNDTWAIEDLNGLQTLIKVKVFTASGQTVFEQNGYIKEWDGQHKGAYVQPGIYYYVITYSDRKKSGYLTIIQ